MVNLLVMAHLGQEVGRDRKIVPGHVPLFVQLLVASAITDGTVVVLSIPAQLVTEVLAGHFLERFVVGAIDIHNQAEWQFFSFCFF